MLEFKLMTTIDGDFEHVLLYKNQELKLLSGMEWKKSVRKTLFVVFPESVSLRVPHNTMFVESWIQVEGDITLAQCVSVQRITDDEVDVESVDTYRSDYSRIF